MMEVIRMSIAAGLAGLLVGCDGATPVVPSRLPPVVDPPLFVTYTLSGEVSEMTAAGRVPVAGATVRETTTGQAGRTDDEGRYRIDPPLRRPAVATITAAKPGYQPTTVTQSVSGDTRIDLQIDRRESFTLSGVISAITRAGLVGIPGVRVEFFSYVASDNYSEGVTTTDAQGRYLLRGVWAGPEVYTGIWLFKDGYRIDPQLSPSCDLCFRTLAITGDTTFDVALEPLPQSAAPSAIATPRVGFDMKRSIR